MDARGLVRQSGVLVLRQDGDPGPGMHDDGCQTKQPRPRGGACGRELAGAGVQESAWGTLGSAL